MTTPPTQAAPGTIVSLDDAKRQLGIELDETGDDAEITSWLLAMTNPVERAKNEVIVQRQFTRTWRSERARKFRLFKVPVVSLDSLTSIQWGTTTTYVSSSIAAGTTTGAYFIDPDTGLCEQIAIGPVELRGWLTASWTAGYAPGQIPQHEVNACLMLLQALWETRRGPGGAQGIIGAEELQDYRHYNVLPRKVTEMLGAPRPVVI